MEYVSTNYANAYRLPTHQMKTSGDNTLLSNNHPPRSVTSRSSRAHGNDLRRHGVDEARSHLTGDTQSQYTRTTQRDIAPVQRSHPQTPQDGAQTPVQAKEAPAKRDVEAEFHAGQRAAEYKYRSDDQLFATNVEFSPGKNRVAENEVVERVFEGHEDPTTQANIANYAYSKYRFFDGPYGKAWNTAEVCGDCRGANHRLAEQKAEEAQVVKKQELNEEIKYLNNLAEIEERKGREEDMRREYRKQIDEYHLSLAKPGENKVEKAQRLREKIRLEAEQVEMQRAHDEVVRNQRQQIYNNELGAQANGRHRADHEAAMRNATLEANHQGLNIGQYKGADKANLAHALDAQIAQKAEMRENVDGFRDQVNNPNDFLNYKDRFDDNNLAIVLENRRMMVHPDNSMAKAQLRDVHEAGVRKNRVQNEEKLRDYEMMNQKIAHEKRVLQEEYLRRAAGGADLRNGLMNQMNDKNVKAVDQVQEGREFKNDFSIGGIRSFGITNIDIRPQLAEKESRQHREKAAERVADANLMAQLDEYDRNKVHVELERKAQFGQMLNSTLNQQIKVTEEKRDRKINQIKKKAARMPARPAPCNHHKCTLCAKVMD